MCPCVHSHMYTLQSPVCTHVHTRMHVFVCVHTQQYTGTHVCAHVYTQLLADPPPPPLTSCRHFLQEVTTKGFRTARLSRVAELGQGSACAACRLPHPNPVTHSRKPSSNKGPGQQHKKLGCWGQDHMGHAGGTFRVGPPEPARPGEGRRVGGTRGTCRKGGHPGPALWGLRAAAPWKVKVGPHSLPTLEF